MDKRRPVSIDGIYQRTAVPKRKLTVDDSTESNNQRQSLQSRNPNMLNSQFNNRNSNVNYSRDSILNSTLPNRQYTQQNLKRGAKLKKKWSRKKKILVTIVIIFLILLGVGGWFGARIIGSIDKVFHGNLFSDLQGVFSNTTLRGENQGRVNILLAGYQGAVSDEGALTDSIMVVSIDTKNNTAFTMSIPRDIWLHIPSMGYQKINDANSNANFNQPGYFKGGMGQLQQVVETDFGIPIDYYALIDYSAFQDAVNAVGGITVNIQSPDPRGLYDPNVDKAHGGPLKLPNGPVHLDGLQALALALARGDSPYAYGFPLSDINRTQHQRQMLIALEQKALSVGVLSNPLTITHLFDAIGSNIKTDLSLADSIKLAQLAKKVNVSQIKSYGLSYAGSNALLKTYVTPTYPPQDALIPSAGLNNFSQIQHYYLQITSSSPVVQEDATVTILNGSNVTNLAHKEESYLRSQGFNVVYIGNASTQYTSNFILDNSNGKKPNSYNFLEKYFNVTPSTSSSSSAEAVETQGYSSNFVVVIGQNWAKTH